MLLQNTIVNNIICLANIGVELNPSPRSWSFQQHNLGHLDIIGSKEEAEIYLKRRVQRGNTS